MRLKLFLTFQSFNCNIYILATSFAYSYCVNSYKRIVLSSFHNTFERNFSWFVNNLTINQLWKKCQEVWYHFSADGTHGQIISLKVMALLWLTKTSLLRQCTEEDHCWSNQYFSFYTILVFIKKKLIFYPVITLFAQAICKFHCC